MHRRTLAAHAHVLMFESDMHAHLCTFLQGLLHAMAYTHRLPKRSHKMMVAEWAMYATKVLGSTYARKVQIVRV
jgi:hypothetical protein